MTRQPLLHFPGAGVDTHRIGGLVLTTMETTELETGALIIGECGGWEHTDQHRHYSVTEAEICAENLDYTMYLDAGYDEQPADWYRDQDWE